jgi:hypothetical protein
MSPSTSQASLGAAGGAGREVMSRRALRAATALICVLATACATKTLLVAQGPSRVPVAAVAHQPAAKSTPAPQVPAAAQPEAGPREAVASTSDGQGGISVVPIADGLFVTGFALRSGRIATGYLGGLLSGPDGRMQILPRKPVSGGFKDSYEVRDLRNPGWQYHISLYDSNFAIITTEEGSF